MTKNDFEKVNQLLKKIQSNDLSSDALEFLRRGVVETKIGQEIFEKELRTKKADARLLDVASVLKNEISNLGPGNLGASLAYITRGESFRPSKPDLQMNLKICDGCLGAKEMMYTGTTLEGQQRSRVYPLIESLTEPVSSDGVRRGVDALTSGLSIDQIRGVQGQIFPLCNWCRRAELNKPGTSREQNNENRNPEDSMRH